MKDLPETLLVSTVYLTRITALFSIFGLTKKICYLETSSTFSKNLHSFYPIIGELMLWHYPANEIKCVKFHLNKLMVLISATAKALTLETLRFC